MSDLLGPKIPSEECPTAETLRVFVLGQLTGDDLATVLNHLYVVRCRRCSELLLTMPQTTASILVPPPLATGRHERITERPVTPSTRVWFGGDPEGFRGLRLRQFLIRDLLGKGGFGAVYEAWDEELDRPVAIKVPFECGLGPEERAKVTAEAKLHASLDHPNVVPIFEVGRTDEIPVYFVSKLIRGQNLGKRLGEGRLALRQAAELLVPVALALDHMRQCGLVHRDVKPRNILLDEKGTPYLTDFGLAMRPAPADGGSSERWMLAGTLPYMSPEQARGDSDRVDHRSDVYALGVVMYELLTGSRPFSGEPTELRETIQHLPPAPPGQVEPGVPRDLETICLKALSKAPEQRYQEARHLAEDLGCWLRGEPLWHAGASGWRRALWWLRLHRERVGWAAVALFVLGLVAWVATRPAPEPEPPQPPPDVRRAVTVRTEPAGANVSYFPLDAKTGEPRPEEVVRGKDGEVVKLLSGYYLLVAVSNRDQTQFHEVFRVVPGVSGLAPGPYRHERWKEERGVVVLARITLPPRDVAKGMSHFPEGTDFATRDPIPKLERGEPVFTPVRRRVPAFYLGTTEVTNAVYLPWLKQADPAKAPPVSRPTFPASSVTWTEAVACAEWFGMRLPDEYEYEYAATDCGKRRFPWGNSTTLLAGNLWKLGPSTQPATRLERVGQPTVYGLYSNALEWTSSWPGEIPQPAPSVSLDTLRVARGGPPTVAGDTRTPAAPEGPRDRIILPGPVHRTAPSPLLGFRFARSAAPRLKAKDFGAVISP